MPALACPQFMYHLLSCGDSVFSSSDCSPPGSRLFTSLTIITTVPIFRQQSDIGVSASLNLERVARVTPPAKVGGVVGRY